MYICKKRSSIFGTPFFFCRERDSLAQSFARIVRDLQVEIRAPVRGREKALSFSQKRKGAPFGTPFFFCGERGIRTPGTSQFNGFQDRRNRPLCHLSFGKTLSSPEIGHKSTAFFSNTQIFCENSCQYAKNIVILQPK